jgi:hypothetical protein
MIAAMMSQAKATGSHFGHEASMMAAARNDGKRWYRRSWPRGDAASVPSAVALA